MTKIPSEFKDKPSIVLDFQFLGGELAVSEASIKSALVSLNRQWDIADLVYQDMPSITDIIHLPLKYGILAEEVAARHNAAISVVNGSAHRLIAALEKHIVILIDLLEQEREKNKNGANSDREQTTGF